MPMTYTISILIARSFFPSPNHQSTTKAPSSPPDILQVIQERFGLRTSSIADDAVEHDTSDDHDQDTISPTASPRQTKRITASATQSPHVRFEGIDDDDHDLVKKQPDGCTLLTWLHLSFSSNPSLQILTSKTPDRPLKSWTWEMRYLHATTQILADAQTTVYFCMNLPAKLQRRITDSVRSMEALAKNPLFMDTLIIDEVIAYYRDVIKSFRTRMIAMVCSLFVFCSCYSFCWFACRFHDDIPPRSYCRRDSPLHVSSYDQCVDHTDHAATERRHIPQH